MAQTAAVVLLAAKILIWLVGVLMAVAYMTYAERRVLALLQVRIGPNRVGPLGLVQPLADAVKLMGKEMLMPDGADQAVFRLAPLMILIPAFLAYAFIPLGPNLRIADANAGVLMVLAVSSLGIYGIIMGGWSSNNKYSALGALRSAAQLISYEVSLTLAALSVVLITSTMNLTAVVEYQKDGPLVLRHPLSIVSFLIFIIAGMAETNRIPFDLPEAESELVGGYHTEYSGMGFGLFYLSEYTNILTVCLMSSLLFLGGWNGPWAPGPHWLILKTLFLVYLFFWVRGSFPRLRCDQLMRFGWKFLLPLATANIAAIGALKAFAP